MLPVKCPCCQAQLKVKSLKCPGCDTEVTGSYEFPVLSYLSESDQDFIVKFIKSSGSLKEMSNELKLSYPTVRNLLDEIIEKIKKQETKHENED